MGNLFLSMENLRLVTMLMIMILFFVTYEGDSSQKCAVFVFVFLICGVLGQSYMDTLIL